MSIFASFDCSISRATRTGPRALSMLIPLHVGKKNDRTRHSQRKHPATTTRQSASASAQHYEKLFIQALVRAGQCSQHCKADFYIRKFCTTKFYSDAKRRRTIASCFKPNYRCFSTQADKRSPAHGAATVEVTRGELKGLVDYYSLEPEQHSTVPSEGVQKDSLQVVLPPDLLPAEKQVTIAMTVQSLKKLLEDENSSHDLVWDIYQNLPQPRVAHLTDATLGDLLHHLSVVPYKTEPSMLRYLSLLEDAQAMKRPIKPSHWTSAISFAGRCLRKITPFEVESALYLWRRMEHEAGVKATSVTFNVLFDVATKAGKFVLAEMIMKEMESRNLKFSRHLRTGIIYHYGLRRDGDGVRKAYRALVDAGEFVDSAVITCVVASLLKCGEAVAAEQVFERAKRLYWQKLDEYKVKLAKNAQNDGLPPSATDQSKPNLPPPPLPPNDWRSARTIGITLSHAAAVLREDPNLTRRDHIQNSIPLAPSIRTYRALIYYHAVTAGDIDRATELLTEINDQGIEPDGIVYLHMFKGYRMHGGVAYTAWTRRRLERLWKEFRTLVERDGVGWRRRDESKPSESFAPLGKIYLNAASTDYALRAFARVVSYERMLEVWDEIKTAYGQDMDSGDEEYVEQVLDHLHPQWSSFGLVVKEQSELDRLSDVDDAAGTEDEGGDEASGWRKPPA